MRVPARRSRNIQRSARSTTPMTVSTAARARAIQKRSGIGVSRGPAATNIATVVIAPTTSTAAADATSSSHAIGRTLAPAPRVSLVSNRLDTWP